MSRGLTVLLRTGIRPVTLEKFPREQIQDSKFHVLRESCLGRLCPLATATRTEVSALARRGITSMHFDLEDALLMGVARSAR